jgi:ankyrin repeat protein
MRKIDRQLFKAIQKNKSLREIKKLIKQGANVNAHDELGKTPLMYTMNYKNKNVHFIYKLFCYFLPFYSNNVRLLNLLLKNGADINLQDKKGNSLIFYIIKNWFIVINSKNYRKRLFINKYYNYLHLGKIYKKILIKLLKSDSKIFNKVFFKIINYIIDKIINLFANMQIKHVLKCKGVFLLMVLNRSNLCIKNKNGFNVIEYYFYYDLYFPKPFAETLIIKELRKLLFEKENILMSTMECINSKNFIQYLYQKKLFSNRKNEKLKLSPNVKTSLY